MSREVYLNGKLIDMPRATVAVSNPSFLHGVGLFETLRTYDGRPFRLEQHIDRLRNSARELNMHVGEAIERIADAVQAVLDANRLRDARVRFTVTPPGSQDEDRRATLLAAAEETAGYPPELYERGMTACICSSWRQSRQDPLAGHKTTSYLSRLLVLRDGQEKGCGETLWFTPDNLLAEGCISNVFVVKDGRLRTPPLDTPVLPGVTRAAVLELAEIQRIPVDEKPCTIDDLLHADEVFLTNAIMEVMPVGRIERHAIADEKPGPITQRLAEAYGELTRSG